MKSSSQDKVLISDLLMWCVENPEIQNIHKIQMVSMCLLCEKSRKSRNRMMIWCTRNQEIYMLIVVGGVRRCSTGCKKLIRNEEKGV
jgi:hypothetical protein